MTSERTLDVAVWLAFPDDFDDEALLDESSPLNADERRRAGKIRHAATHRGYLVGRLLVRTALSQLGDEAPARWEIVIGELGKPHLGPAHAALDLRFNLSHVNPVLERHTDSPTAVVACAICHGRAIGVDVEDVRRRVSTDDLAKRFFSARESSAMFALDAVSRRERFFELWTLKESYIKARGKGMAIPLGSFSFELTAPGEIGFDVTAETQDGRSWHHALLSPTPDHRLALTVERRDEPSLHISAQRLKVSGEFEPARIPLLRQS